MDTLTERPMPQDPQARDDAPVTLYCQRCGARDRAWIISTTSSPAIQAHYFAKVCGLCVRGVMHEIELMAPYQERVTITLTLIDSGM